MIKERKDSTILKMIRSNPFSAARRFAEIMEPSVIRRIAYLLKDDPGDLKITCEYNNVWHTFTLRVYEAPPISGTVEEMNYFAGATASYHWSEVEKNPLLTFNIMVEHMIQKYILQVGELL